MRIRSGVFSGAALLLVAGGLSLGASNAAARPPVVGSSATASVTVAAAPTAGTFVPATPTRILDTRIGLGAAKFPVRGGSSIAVQILGRGGIPASGVAAVVMNVTVVGPTVAGNVRVWPDGVAMPNSSNLNFVAGQTVANLTMVKVGVDGKIRIADSAGSVDALADVSGYYVAGSSPSAGSFHALVPSRVLDTRIGLGAAQHPVYPGGKVDLKVGGLGGVPSTGVVSVVMNLTVVTPTASGDLQVSGPDGAADTSSLNFAAHQTVAGLVIATIFNGLGYQGHVEFTNGSGGYSEVVGDVLGYYDSGDISSVGAYAGVGPTRILDTRSGLGAAAAPIAAQGTLSLAVKGRGGVPTAGVSSVIINLTAVSAKASGNVRAWADGSPVPVVSNLNLIPGATVPNLAVVPVGADGKIRVLNNSTGSVNLLVDVVGYFTSAARPAWTQPADAQRQHGDPHAISCASATFCLAADNVGNSGVFNGTTWSAPQQATIGDPMSSVSCVTDTFCVGYRGDKWVRVFDGTSWGPNVDVLPDEQFGGFDPVSCATVTFCVVVGEQGLSAVFDGTKSVGEYFVPGGETPLSLSCPAAGLCFAGGWEGQTYTFHTGAGWKKQQTFGSSTGYVSVSCSSATFCVAASSSGAAAVYRGATWTKTPAPSTAGPFVSVSCDAVKFCLAIDSRGKAFHFDGTNWGAPETIDPAFSGAAVASCVPDFCEVLDRSGLSATRVNGTWGNPLVFDAANDLTSVSCPSTGWCQGVDQAGDALQFSGTAWNAPHLIDPNGSLTSVSCSAATFCAAVDSAGQALTFDGTSWSPPVVVAPSRFVQVSCASSTFCVALDLSAHIFTFNGTAWTVRPPLAAGAVGQSISCPTASFCAAVTTDGRVFTFNGTNFSVGRPIDPSGGLTAVSCASTTSCVVSDHSGGTVIWDGATWTRSAVNLPTPAAVLSCVSSHFCLAGSIYGGIFIYDGTGWAGPTNVTSRVSLSCASATFCLSIDVASQFVVSHG